MLEVRAELGWVNWPVYLDKESNKLRTRHLELVVILAKASSTFVGELKRRVVKEEKVEEEVVVVEYKGAVRSNGVVARKVFS